MGSSLVEGQTYVRLGESRLTVAGNKLEVSNIPSGYRFLIIYINVSSTAGTTTNAMRYNNDAGAHYSTQMLKGDSSGTITAFNDAGTHSVILDGINAGSPASLFLQMNQSPINGKKGYSCTGGCQDRTYTTSGYYDSAIEINTVTLEAGAGTYNAGSEILVYGVR